MVKSERVRQIPYEIIYMWNVKYDTNELIHKTERFTVTKQKDSQTQNKFIVIKGEKEWGEGINQEFGLADTNYYI